MTAQVPDLVVVGRAMWSLAGVDGGPLFDPAGAGFTLAMISTACWRGYLCRYQAAAGSFGLEGLALGIGARIGGQEIGPGTTWRGRVAIAAGDSDRWLPGHGFWFRGLGLPVSFTGRLLLGRGLIGPLMVNMGYHPAWKYQDVLELELVGGLVTGRRDRSGDLAEIRARITSGEIPDPDGRRGYEQWVSRVFTLDYDRSLPAEPGNDQAAPDPTS